MVVVGLVVDVFVVVDDDVFFSRRFLRSDLLLFGPLCVVVATTNPDDILKVN